MRAINEDDVKRLIRSEKRNWGLTQFPGVTEALNHVEGGLVGIRTVESPMPRWISVEERLPEGEGWVLAIGLLLKRRSKGNYGWCVPHVAEYRHGRWCDSDGMIPDLEESSLKITHWMPLPEPPEEE